MPLDSIRKLVIHRDDLSDQLLPSQTYSAAIAAIDAGVDPAACAHCLFTTLNSVEARELQKWAPVHHESVPVEIDSADARFCWAMAEEFAESAWAPKIARPPPQPCGKVAASEVAVSGLEVTITVTARPPTA